MDEAERRDAIEAHRAWLLEQAFKEAEMDEWRDRFHRLMEEEGRCRVCGNQGDPPRREPKLPF